MRQIPQSWIRGPSSPRRALGARFWGVLPALVPAILPAAAPAAGAAGAGGSAAATSHRQVARPPRAGPVSPLLTPRALPAPLRIAPAREFGFLGPTTPIAPAALRAAAVHALPVGSASLISPGSSAATRHYAAALPGAPARTADSTANVVLDNTLVTARPVPFANNTFTITPNLARQAGGNLFYSFGAFSLSAGQTASFTGNPAMPVKNVLVRVTGGQASAIDGTLACTYPDANVYFMNPGGVVFGPNAALDLKGSFAVTTAEVIKLSDGGSFGTGGAGASVLTAAPPTAFSFLSAKPADISLIGAVVNDSVVPSKLEVPDGKVLSVVGGGVQLVAAILKAPSGRVNVVAAGAPGEVRFDPSSAAAGIDTSAAPVLANVLMLDSSVDTDANAAGSVVLRASGLSMDLNATIAALTKDGPGGPIDVVLTGPLTLAESSFIATNTTGAGAAGAVAVKAHAVTIDDPSGFSFIGSLALPDSSGAGGATEVNASSLQLAGSGRVSSFAGGTGDAGAIVVTADTIGLSGEAAQIVSQSAGPGRGGAITLRHGTLTLDSGAQIFSRGAGAGAGGAIDIEGGNVSITGANSSIFGDGGAADTGITLKAANLMLDNKASINTEAFTGSASGGAIQISAGAVRLDHGSEITSATIATGPAGPISITARELDIGAACNVRANTFSSGAGGTISVHADQLTIAGGDIDSVAGGGAGGAVNPGPGGDITVTAGNVQLTGGGLISSSTINSGNGGKITLTANNLFFSGNNSGVRSPSIVTSQGTDLIGQLLTFSNPVSGNGGDIAITAGRMAMQDGASIAASAVGADPLALSTGRTGLGGQISIHAGRLSLASPNADQATTITSRTTVLTPGTGSAGSVQVHVGRFELTGASSSINVSTSGAGDAGGILISAGNARVRGGAIAATSTGSGDAGSVTIRAAGRLALAGGGSAAVSAAASAGGDVSLAAGRDLLLERGTVTAASGGTGGNINLSAGQHIDILESKVDARAGGDGGHVTIDPPAITLRNSTIDARSNGRPVRVTIEGSLLKERSQILTDAPQSFPAVDLAGSLLALPPAAPGAARLLPEVCGMKLGANLSSFIVTGRGGLPPEPRGWSPDPAAPDGPDWMLLGLNR